MSEFNKTGLYLVVFYGFGIKEGKQRKTFFIDSSSIGIDQTLDYQYYISNTTTPSLRHQDNDRVTILRYSLKIC